jgi:hypothetical protein
MSTAVFNDYEKYKTTALVSSRCRAVGALFIVATRWRAVKEHNPGVEDVYMLRQRHDAIHGTKALPPYDPKEHGRLTSEEAVNEWNEFMGQSFRGLSQQRIDIFKQFLDYFPAEFARLVDMCEERALAGVGICFRGVLLKGFDSYTFDRHVFLNFAYNIYNTGGPYILFDFIYCFVIMHDT